jgi:broad specificity phosphatase PhoE
MSKTVKFVVVRLCECEGNTTGRLCNQGQLTPLGKRQAVASRDLLQGFEIVSWAAPNNSACQETARILADGRPCVLADEFHEPPYPKWAGLTIAQVQAQWPEEWRRYFNPQPGDATRIIVPGGESFADTFKHLDDGVKRLFSEHADNSCIGIVTHGENVRLLACGFLGVPLENLFRLRGHNGGVTIFNYDGVSATFSCINESAHLVKTKDFTDYLSA